MRNHLAYSGLIKLILCEAVGVGSSGDYKIQKKKNVKWLTVPHPLYFCLWLMNRSVAINLVSHTWHRYPTILYFSFFPLSRWIWEGRRAEGEEVLCNSKRTLFSPTGRLFYFFFFCTCSTIEHCTWAPYFTSCQSVKGSEQLRKKRVYMMP